MKNEDNSRNTAQLGKDSLNSTNSLSKDGIYIYRHWSEAEKRWITETYDPNVPGNSKEWTIILSEMDHKEELQERYICENLDYRYLNSKARAEENGRLDQATEDFLKDPAPEIIDQAFPEASNQSPKVQKVRRFIDSLPRRQQNLIFDHVFGGKTLEELRQREIAQSGIEVTQQAFSNRLKKIKEKGRKALVSLYNVPNDEA